MRNDNAHSPLIVPVSLGKQHDVRLCLRICVTSRRDTSVEAKHNSMHLHVKYANTCFDAVN